MYFYLAPEASTAEHKESNPPQVESITVPLEIITIKRIIENERVIQGNESMLYGRASKWILPLWLSKGKKNLSFLRFI